MLTKTKIENRNSSISLIRCVAMMFIVTCKAVMQKEKDEYLYLFR